MSHNTTGVRYALKRVARANLSAKEQELINREKQARKVEVARTPCVLHIFRVFKRSKLHSWSITHRCGL